MKRAAKAMVDVKMAKVVSGMEKRTSVAGRRVDLRRPMVALDVYTLGTLYTPVIS